MSELVEATPSAAGVTYPTSDEAQATVSNVAMHARLTRVAAIAEDALANLPADDVKCWEHLISALGKIETVMLIHTAEKPLDPPPVHDAPPAEPTEPEKKVIGNFAGKGKVVSYAIDRDMAVTVTATLFDEKMWRFKGIKDGEALIYGHILGGKYQAMQYCKFIRNGIVSRANRVRRRKRNASKEVQA